MSMLFKRLLPMEPVKADAVPAGQGYLYQVKWDGVRIIAHVGDGRVMLHNRKLKDRTQHYPELASLLQLVRGSAVLDGELVAFKNGKPNFPLVLERDLINPERFGGRGKLSGKIPVFYLVFDLLWLNGQDLTSFPLKKRQELLHDCLDESDIVRQVENFADGEALYTAVAEKELEGIVAKKESSLYKSGKKSRDWLKIKIRRRQLVVIGGYTVKNGRPSALLVGAFRQGKPVYLGSVASGLSERDFSLLIPYLQKNKVSEPPFAGAAFGRDRIWAKPSLTALVEFAEWTEDLRMRQPVFIGFTKDKPDECVLS